MGYNPDDPEQNAYWDEDLAARLDRISRELYEQSDEAARMNFPRVSRALRQAYDALLYAAEELRREATELRQQEETP